MAEAVLNRVGAGRFEAFSAGSHPTGQVHPLALELLGRRGYATEGLRSKSWDEFAAGTRFDFVLTVCDRAAAETCPVGPGRPTTAHWGLPDPAARVGTAELRREAFAAALQTLERRIGRFVALPLASLDPAELRGQLTEIGSS